MRNKTADDCPVKPLALEDDLLFLGPDGGPVLVADDTFGTLLACADILIDEGAE